MAIFNLRITVWRKGEVKDPQSEAILDIASNVLKYPISSLKMGKIFDLSIEAGYKEKAKEDAQALADKLLSNEVIETYQLEFI